MDADPKTLPHRLIDEDGELLCADCQGCFSEAGGVLGPGDETGECGERWKSECAALRARIAVIVTPVDGVDVEEVLRLDREATPGPWDQAWPTCVTTGGTHGDAIADGCEEEDAELIATYRTAAPALAREVQRLRAELDQTRTALRLATDPKPDDLLGVRLVNGCASLPDDTPEWVALLLREAWTAIRVLRADAEGKAARIASLDEKIEEAYQMLREGLLAGPLVTGRTEVGLRVRDRLLGWVFTSFAAELERSDAPNNLSISMTPDESHAYANYRLDLCIARPGCPSAHEQNVALRADVERLCAEIEELRRAEAAALYLPEGGADLGYEVWSEGWVKQVGERDEHGETDEAIVIEDMSAAAHPRDAPYRRSVYRKNSLIAFSHHRSPRAAMKAGS